MSCLERFFLYFLLLILRLPNLSLMQSFGLHKHSLVIPTPYVISAPYGLTHSSRLIPIRPTPRDTFPEGSIALVSVQPHGPCAVAVSYISSRTHVLNPQFCAGLFLASGTSNPITLLLFLTPY